jgi:hypothetical protein
MTVLIATANTQLFLDFNSKIKFEPSTANTCIFRITEKKFIQLRQYVRDLGYNPFSIMAW